MGLRITDKSAFRLAAKTINQNRIQLSELQIQTSTGKRINKPSDDPSGITTLMDLNNQITRFEQFKKNIDRGKTLLQGSDSSLNSSTNILVRMKELAIQMSNDTINADDRALAAEEVNGAKETLLNLANTQIGDTYLFGGLKTESAPFDSTGAFQGNTTIPEVEVGNNVTQKILTNGQNAFGDDSVSSTEDIFDILDDLSAALSANDMSGINTQLDRIDNGINQLNNARADVGVKLNKLRLSETILDQFEIDTKVQKSNVEDIDMVQAINDFTLVERALNASLSVSAKILQPTLLNFM